MLEVVIRNEVISLIPKAKRDVVLLRSESGRHHLDHHGQLRFQLHPYWYVLDALAHDLRLTNHRRGVLYSGCIQVGIARRLLSAAYPCRVSDYLHV